MLISCEQYRARTASSTRYKADFFPGNLLLDHELEFSLKWIEGIPIIHVGDAFVEFENSTVLREKTDSALFLSSVESWVLQYTGYPIIIRLSQESGFAENTDRDPAVAHGISLQFSVIYSYNSIDSSDTYQNPLQHVFKIMCKRQKNKELETLLRYSVIQLQDSM